MAIYCSNCGKEHPDNASFCINCGKPLKGTPQTASSAEPRWEYQVFTMPLSGREYEVTGVPFDAGVPSTNRGNIAQEIEHAVNILLNRVSADGWEPVEAVDANSLWKAQHVTRQYKNRFMSTFVIPTEVQIRCRRKVTGQTGSASNPSGTLSASTIKPVRSTTQLQPQIESTWQRSSQGKQHGCIYYAVAILALLGGLFCLGSLIYYFFVPVGVPDPITHITMHSTDQKFSNMVPGLILGVICLAIAVPMFFGLRKQ